MSRTLRSTAAGLLLVSAAAGCSADSPDPEQQRRVIEEISPPAASWTAHRAEVADVLVADEGGRLREVGGVWVSDGPGYGVAWRTPVPAGDEADRCTEASRWLTATAPQFPGEPAPGFSSTPSAGKVYDRCLAALTRGESGSAVSDVFATSRNTRQGDVQYGGWLTFRGVGQERTLIAAAVADTTE